MEAQVTDLTFDTDAIREAIIDRAAESILSDWDYTSAMRADIRDKVDAIFRKKADEEIAAAVTETTRAAFDREYQRHDGFGDKKGAPTTIRKELERLASDYWAARVDRSGKPANDSYNSTSRAEWMMAQICGESFSKDMKQHVVNATAQLKDGLREQLHQHTNVMLNDLFRVRTKGERYP